MIAIQDFYPDHFAQCYGCGRLNEHGIKLKTSLHGEETLTRFIPSKNHTAIPGFVYGGILASVIDCHGTGSASLAIAKEKSIKIEKFNAPRCVTASLKVDYRKPTPIDSEIEVIGKIKEIKGKKVVVEAFLYSKGELCVTGEIVAIHVNDDFGKK